MTDPSVPGEHAPPTTSSRWQDIADRADVGLVRIDAMGNVVDLNAAAARLLGRSMADLRGRDFRTLAAADEGVVVDRALQALRDEDRPVVRHIRYVKPNGGSVSTLSHFTRVCDVAGVLRAVTVVLLDVGAAAPEDTADVSDELRHAMEALRASEDRYRTLFDSIDEGFCVIEVLFEGERAVDYRFVECNPAF